MQEIGNILPAVFRRHVRRENPRVAEILASFWPRIVGAPVARNSRPASFSNGVLTLVVTDGSWGAQLDSLATQVLARINSFFGVPVVEKFYLRVAFETAAEARKWMVGNRGGWPELPPGWAKDPSTDHRPMRTES